MDDIIVDLKNRRREALIHLEFVDQLEKKGIGGNLTGDEGIYLNIIKSSAVLIIYNMIESVVCNCFEHYYNEARASRVNYSAASVELRDVWLRSRLKFINDNLVNFDTVRRNTIGIIESVVNGDVFNLNFRETKPGGTVNDELVRRYCTQHGINFVIHPKARGGAVLQSIMVLRNSLAHGLTSFSSAATHLSYVDLSNYLRETYIFLVSLVKSFLRHIRAGI